MKRLECFLHKAIAAVRISMKYLLFIICQCLTRRETSRVTDGLPWSEFRKAGKHWAGNLDFRQFSVSDDAFRMGVGKVIVVRKHIR